MRPDIHIEQVFIHQVGARPEHGPKSAAGGEAQVV
jgi:hypothetical protein